MSVTTNILFGEHRNFKKSVSIDCRKSVTSLCACPHMCWCVADKLEEVLLSSHCNVFANHMLQIT